MASISAIVPVYNVQDFLEECLDSIVAQTFTDFEVICVNDGSTDDSRDIVTRYVETDSRFKLVDKSNGGPSSARNAGIKQASSPYVCFVDSDDRITPDACEKIVAAFHSSDADVLTFGANCIPASAASPWLINHLSPRDIEYEGFSPALLFEEMSCPFHWRTSCKRDFLIENKILFDEDLHLGEDQVFHFAVYPRASKTLLMSDKLYEYRVVREGSQMNRIARDPARKMTEHIKVTEHIFLDWSSGGFLKQYPAEMIAWTVEYALFESARQSWSLRKVLLSNLRRVWLEYFSKEEILALEFPKATGDLVKAVLAKPESFNEAHWISLRCAYDAQQNELSTTMAARKMFYEWRKKKGLSS